MSRFKIGSTSEHTNQFSGNHTRFLIRRSSDRSPGETYITFVDIYHKPRMLLGDANVMFCPKNMTMHASLFCRTIFHQYSNPQPLYYNAGVGTTLLAVYSHFTTVVNLCYIETTDYPSNFAKTILSENCSCLSKIPYSISVEFPRIILVSRFDSRRSLSSAK